MDVKILLAVLSCLALSANSSPALQKNHYILSGVFIPTDALKHFNKDLEINNNNQGSNDGTAEIKQNSDHAQTYSALKINPTNQQQNQQPIIVHQSQPLETIVAGQRQPIAVAGQQNQPQQLYVAQQNQPQPVVGQPQQVIIGQPNQQGVYVVQPNQPNQQAVIYTPSNGQQVPSNQQQILVSRPGQSGQQTIWVTPAAGGQPQQFLVSQPNQVSPTGQQHGQAILVPKPGENNVYTFIPLNDQNNNNQNQAVSNGNTIWVPVQ